MEILALTIAGDPVAKGRPRVAKTGHAYTPAKTKEAEAALREQIEKVITMPYKGAVGLAVEFYCATLRRTDGDNLMKLVTDAMNKLVYADDSQIEEWYCRVHRKVPGEEPRTEIFVYSLGDVVEQEELALDP